MAHVIIWYVLFVVPNFAGSAWKRSVIFTIWGMYQISVYSRVNRNIFGATFAIFFLYVYSPSGCTFWGKKPWSRKKKLLWQLGTLVGAPVGIALVAGIAVPAMIIGNTFIKINQYTTINKNLLNISWLKHTLHFFSQVYPFGLAENYIPDIDYRVNTSETLQY